ncbi:MAG: hypothetical protein AAGG75_07660 [Bacteroidota bacterium]
MRFSYRCPKCDSPDVVEVIGHNINQMQKIALNKWSMKQAVLDRYICTSCGYTEEYVQLTDSFKRWARQELDKQDRKYDDYV